ncbi:hypothetical protein [Streptomyces chrestomyceticus]|uniref:hypothetical protein n=1 Tax=Streptomyces chrestomyceticus TaxID=68185 RepID=UPI0019CFF5B3|nr:hypothetical protein [Streptomyces chrestomyceticus]
MSGSGTENGGGPGAHGSSAGGPSAGGPGAGDGSGGAGDGSHGAGGGSAAYSQGGDPITPVSQPPEDTGNPETIGVGDTPSQGHESPVPSCSNSAGQKVSCRVGDSPPTDEVSPGPSRTDTGRSERNGGGGPTEQGRQSAWSDTGNTRPGPSPAAGDVP